MIRTASIRVSSRLDLPYGTPMTRSLFHAQVALLQVRDRLTEDHYDRMATGRSPISGGWIVVADKAK